MDAFWGVFVSSFNQCLLSIQFRYCWRDLFVSSKGQLIFFLSLPYMVLGLCPSSFLCLSLSGLLTSMLSFVRPLVSGVQFSIAFR